MAELEPLSSSSNGSHPLQDWVRFVVLRAILRHNLYSTVQTRLLAWMQVALLYAILHHSLYR